MHACVETIKRIVCFGFQFGRQCFSEECIKLCRHFAGLVDEPEAASQPSASEPPAVPVEEIVAVEPAVAATAEAAPHETTVMESGDGDATSQASMEVPGTETTGSEAAASEAPAAVPHAAAEAKRPKKEKKPKKPLTKAERRAAELKRAFRDYFQFAESISRLPPHRVLAINRGERARAIRVKIEADERAMEQEASHYLVAPDHPQAEFLRQCVRDSLTRLIIPSLERELRRELTEKAEEHAVEVFVRNLRKLLLQQPVRGRRVFEAM